jgi:phosphoenolpyruvate synthase/pyruvate phosphate dikinase
MNAAERAIVWFDQIGSEGVPRVGGKNASLGERFDAMGGHAVEQAEWVGVYERNGNEG